MGHDGWREPSVDEVVAKLEAISADPEAARQIGREAAAASSIGRSKSHDC
jgi:hypothetical protein